MTNAAPLVLLHPLAMSASAWDDVRPELEPHHDVIALTALGHRGGAHADRRPVTVQDLVDDAEQALDERGLEQPHIAGNSIGAWVAIELARRGRARTVTAFSPAGPWTAGTEEQALGVRKIGRAIKSARLGRPFPTSALMRSAALRRFVFRDVAVHGDRLTPAQATEATRDLLGCVVADDLLSTTEELAPLDPLPCPITLAWSGEDELLSLAINGRIARQRLPDAHFTVLHGVGHVPMVDDPDAVAATILQVTSESTSRAASAHILRS